MKLKYENIFWNQGFKHAYEISGDEKERGCEVEQFENDVTKALMLTIKHGKGMFKALKGLLENHKTLRALKHEKILDDGYYFQVTPRKFSRERKDEKCVIPIVLKSKLTPEGQEKEEDEKGSIADLILESKNYYFLVESKTLSGYTEEQIKRYLKDFFIEKQIRGFFSKRDKPIHVYWEDLQKN